MGKLTSAVVESTVRRACFDDLLSTIRHDSLLKFSDPDDEVTGELT